MKKQKATIAVLLAAALMLTACQAPSADSAKGKSGSAGKVSQSTAALDNKSFDNFRVTELDGTQTDMDSLLKNASLTVLQVWEPSCESCKDELKALAALSEQYAGTGVQIIGIIKGVTSAPNQGAQAVLKETHAKYIQLLDSKELDSQLPALMKETPSTLFVDKNRDILTSVYKKANDKNFWEKEIDTYRAQANGDSPAAVHPGG